MCTQKVKEITPAANAFATKWFLTSMNCFFNETIGLHAVADEGHIAPHRSPFFYVKAFANTLNKQASRARVLLAKGLEMCISGLSDQN